MRTKFLVIASIMLFLSTIFLLDSFFFAIQEIEIEGNDILPKEVIYKMIPQDKTLLSLNKKELSEKLKSIPLIEETHISLKLMHKLVVKIKEKKIVGKIIYQNKNYLLTSKGSVISEKSYFLPKKLPEIYFKKKVNLEELILLSTNLEMVKFYDPVFFEKINKIFFDGDEVTNIFIVCNSKNYILNGNARLEDFLRIRYLDSRRLNFSYFDLRGSYIITRKG